MKPIVWGCLALLAWIPICAHAEMSPKDMNKLIDQTNFIIGDHCSATLIDLENRYFLTAHHCITDQFKQIEREEVEPDGSVSHRIVMLAKPGQISQLAFSGPNESWRVTLVYKIVADDKYHDLALLQVKADLSNDEAAKIACVEPKRLDKVYAVGNPMGMYGSVTDGIVSSTQRTYGTLPKEEDDKDYPELAFMADTGLTHHTAPISPGNSGGALLNADGELIGVNVIATSDFVNSFAVPLSDIREFLTAAKVDLPECK